MYAALCVLTGSMFRFIYSRLSFIRKNVYTSCVPSYFIDIFLYIISYVNVHFCCSYKSAKIKLGYFLLLLQYMRLKSSKTYSNIDTIYKFRF